MDDNLIVTILKQDPPRPMHYLVQGTQSDAECFLDRFNKAVKTYNVPAAVRTQVRFPRSKKRRIREKWSKQDRNFRTQIIQFTVGEKEMEFLRSFQKLDEDISCGTRVQPHRVLGRGYEFGVPTDRKATSDGGHGERAANDEWGLPIRGIEFGAQYPPKQGH